MDLSEFFGLDSYHILLALVGASILLAYWLPRFVFGWQPAVSALLTILGAVSFSFVPGMPEAFDPLNNPRIWERFSELALIVALFGTGLRIDRIGGWREWLPAVRLLAIVMPVSIAAVALLGWGIGGMTVAGAIILGAVLSPTDPVLAGDLQVGPPLEGREHPLRFSLTTEAGLNDGLAYPFYFLGMLIATYGYLPSGWAAEWLLRDVLYMTLVGALAGAAIGWLLGHAIFTVPRGNALALSGNGLIALAGAALCYGATGLLEGNGFIAAFTAGVVLRRMEADHVYHRRMHFFSEAVEHALTAMILFLLGGAMPLLLLRLSWEHALIGVALLLLIRPAAAWFSLAGTELRGPARWIAAFYGVRGIGSIYYLGLACSQIEFLDEAQLWATIGFTVLLSTILHGLTAGWVIGRYVKEE